MADLRTFLECAGDFAELCSKKKKQAEVSKIVEEELQVLRNFYDMAKALIEQSEMDVLAYKKLAVNEHIKAKLLEHELRSAYNVTYRRDRSLFVDLVKNTPIPSMEELDKEVHLKSKQA